MPIPSKIVNGEQSAPLTVAQVAELLGLTPSCVRSQIDRGEICAIRQGKSYRCFLSFGELRSVAKQQTAARRKAHERQQREAAEAKRAEENAPTAVLEKLRAKLLRQEAGLIELRASVERDEQREQRAIAAALDAGLPRPILFGGASFGAVGIAHSCESIATTKRKIASLAASIAAQPAPDVEPEPVVELSSLDPALTGAPDFGTGVFIPTLARVTAPGDPLPPSARRVRP